MILDLTVFLITQIYKLLLKGDFFPIPKVLALFEKESRVGPPVKLNYQALLRSLIVRIHENIPTQKALIARLKSDLRLKLSVGFLYSDPIPSEATYSRVMSILADNLSVLELSLIHI